MIPVILIHKGQSSRYPLEAIMEHDRKFGNEVILLGDEPSADRQRFEDAYVHLSTNHVEFEKFCISRWLILRGWMRTKNIDKVLYTDSDVLLYCNAEREWATWAEPYALTLALGTSAATSYFTLAGVSAFCDFILDIYVNRNDNFREFERIFKEMRAQDLPGGIGDMTIFKFFKEQVAHIKVGEMTEIKDSATFDHNVNAGDSYLMKDGIKDFHWIEGRPYAFREQGKAVRFNSIHCQGQAKRLIRGYLR